MRQEILSYLNKYLGGEYTYFGKYTKWIPFRDAAAFDKRVKRMRLMQAAVEAMTDGDEFKAAFIAEYSDFVSYIATEKCDSRSLGYMRDDIHKVIPECKAIADKALPKDEAEAKDAPVDDEAVTVAAADTGAAVAAADMQAAVVATGGTAEADDAVAEAAAEVAVGVVDAAIEAGVTAAAATVAANALALVPVERTRDYTVGLEAAAVPSADFVKLFSRLSAGARVASRAQGIQWLNAEGVEAFSKLNHYQRLGLTEAARDEEIKAAYHKKARLFHPDKRRGVERVYAQRVFQHVQGAYEVLSDRNLRRNYDTELWCQRFRQSQANLESKKPEKPPGCVRLLAMMPVPQARPREMGLVDMVMMGWAGFSGLCLQAATGLGEAAVEVASEVASEVAAELADVWADDHVRHAGVDDDPSMYMWPGVM